MTSPFRLFEVYRTDETRIETLGALLGWGCQFPSGTCIVEWNLEAFPEDDRLDNEHTSRYGSIADVEQGTGGQVEFVEADVGFDPEKSRLDTAPGDT